MFWVREQDLTVGGRGKESVSIHLRSLHEKLMGEAARLDKHRKAGADMFRLKEPFARPQRSFLFPVSSARERVVGNTRTGEDRERPLPA